MNRSPKHPNHGTDTRQHRVNTSVWKPQKPVSDSDIKSETRSTRHKSKGYEYSPAPIWHNILYGLGSAGAILGPLLIPGVGYMDVMLWIAAISAGIFLIVSLVGIFQGFLPLGRQEQRGRH